MNVKGAPIFYSFLEKRVIPKEAEKKNIIRTAKIKGYYSDGVVCNRPDKPISKLLKK